mgnify:CR=1 FL=1
MEAVRCPTPFCGKKVAEHLEGRGWFFCNRCKRNFIEDRRIIVDKLKVGV